MAAFNEKTLTVIAKCSTVKKAEPEKSLKGRTLVRSIIFFTITVLAFPEEMLCRDQAVILSDLVYLRDADNEVGFLAGRSLSPSFFPDRGEMPKTPKFSFFY